jgi:hypothetical protein
MMWTLQHARADGTFVIERDGYPYHVIADDPLFEAVAQAAQGTVLPPEPVPVAPEMPPQRRVVSALVFLDRLTQAERIAIRRAARANEKLEDWLDMLRAAQEVDLDDPRTTGGMAAIVDAGLLTAARRDEILG